MLTPGTLVDETLLDDGATNRVAIAVLVGTGPAATAAVAVAELSTGAFDVEEVSPAQLADVVARVAPRELLVPESTGSERDAHDPISAAKRESGCPCQELPEWMFRAKDAAGLLRQHYGVVRLDAFDLTDDGAATVAAG